MNWKNKGMGVSEALWSKNNQNQYIRNEEKNLRMDMVNKKTKSCKENTFLQTESTGGNGGKGLKLGTNPRSTVTTILMSPDYFLQGRREYSNPEPDKETS